MSDLYVVRRDRSYELRRTAEGPSLGIIGTGPNMHPWGWTIGLGWHVGRASYDECLAQMTADPMFGAS